MAPLARLERTTFRLGGGPSILVRYGGRYEIHERYCEDTEPLLFRKSTPKGAKQGAKNFPA